MGFESTYIIAPLELCYLVPKCAFRVCEIDSCDQFILLCISNVGYLPTYKPAEPAFYDPGEFVSCWTLLSVVSYLPHACASAPTYLLYLIWYLNSKYYDKTTFRMILRNPSQFICSLSLREKVKMPTLDT